MSSQRMLSNLLLMLLALAVIGFVYSTRATLANTLKPDQPHMQAARTALQSARNELQVAEANKGGHRVRAIELVDQAIAEVDAGIEYDRSHDHAFRLSKEAVVVLSPDQPHMKAALNLLKDAQKELKAATPDKGGHRVKAMQIVDQAIAEVKAGISFAK